MSPPRSHRSDPPFFESSDVLSAIHEVATRDELVVYAGAGATIDSINLGWPELVTALIEKHPDDFTDGESDYFTSFVRRHSPQSISGSVVRAYYEQQFLEDATDQLVNRIRVLLYNRDSWRGGQLANSIANLACARAAAGKITRVVTTNYDDFLEQSLQLAVQRLSNSPLAQHDLEVRRTIIRPDRKTKLAAPRPRSLDIVYLHGHVPRSGKWIRPVLSEADYVDSEAESASVLTRLLGQSDALIIGSSLIDPPLLKALKATASPGLRRTALVPLQDKAWAEAPPDERKAHIRHMTSRVQSFGVKPVFPDFYVQVSQFAIEAAFGAREGGYVPATGGQYGERLWDWWSRWWAEVGADEHAAQIADHSYLVDELAKLTPLLSPTGPLKLEIWVRWAPSASNRFMRLWASSASCISSTALMRNGQIENDSPYVSVRTFCDGRPVLERMPTSTSDRWTEYLAKPIWLPEPDEIPVAVVTLAAMTGRVMPDNKLRGPVLERLEQIGRWVAGRQPIASAP